MSSFKRILVALILTAGTISWSAQSVNLAWDASPDPSVAGYSIYYGPAPGAYTNKLDAGSALSVTTPALPDGTYYFSATAHDAAGVESDFANVVSTNVMTTTNVTGTAPMIVTQPKDVSCVAGSPAIFSVVASGTSPAYQWFRNGAALTDGGNVSGANTASLKLASVSHADENNYCVVASNAWGKVTSSYVILTLTNGVTQPPPTAPVIVAQPSSLTVDPGASVTFGVLATGSAPLSYQWQFNGAGISGATASNYAIASVGANNAGTYSCNVSNSAGSVTSSGAMLTLTIPTSVQISPTNQTVNAGDAFSLSAVVSGPNSNAFQWSRNGNPILGATSSTLTVANALRANAGTYTVSVVGNTSATSNPATVTVVDPFFYLQPVSKALVIGQSYTFTAAANGTPIPGYGSPFMRYQWYVQRPGATPAPITSKTNTSLTVSSVKKNDAGTYYCVVTNAFLPGQTITPNGNVAQSSSAVLSVYSKQSQIPASMAMSTMALAASPSPAFAAVTYNGLFAPADGISPGNAGALANFVVRSNGSFSGKLSLAGAQHSVSGTFDNSGAAAQTFSRDGKESIVVSLQLDGANSQIIGSVSCAAEGWTSPLRAVPALNGATNPNAMPSRSVILLDNMNGTAVQGVIINTATGVVRMTGVLADGAKISTKMTLAQNGDWPLHMDLYHGTGLLQGWLTSANDDPTGTLTWIKEGTNGFTNTLTVTPQTSVPLPEP